MIRWKKPSTIVHRMSKKVCYSMDFLPRDDLSKDDCPCVTHQEFHRAHSWIASTRMIKNHKLPLIVSMVSSGKVSLSNTWNIKNDFIISTTCVVGWSVQETFGFNLLPSPYSCNFLFWLGFHGLSLFKDPSQVTITCHMSNVMAI